MPEHNVEIDALLARVEAALAPVDETWGGAAMALRDRVRVAIRPPRPRTSDHTETADEFLARTRVIPPARLASIHGRHPAACFENGCVCDLHGPAAIPTTCAIPPEVGAS